MSTAKVETAAGVTKTEAAPRPSPDPKYRADVPLTNPGDDKLGRDALCKALAEMIERFSADESITIGLFGPWGCGKSSMLSLIQYHLEHDNNARSSRVIRFNPWQIVDREQLQIAFFNQLRLSILAGSSFGGARTFWDKLLTKFGKVPANISPDERKLENWLVSYALAAGIYSIIPLAGGIIGTFILLFRLVTLMLRRRFAAQRDVEELHERINNSLRRLPYRLVVLIDDIDRLAADEIRLVFQLIKSVANFKNVTYILALDWDVVDHALRKLQGSSGVDYLGKICQITCDVPEVGSEYLDQFVADGVNEILSDLDHSDNKRFEAVFLSTGSQLLTTIRDANRVLNAYQLNWAVLRKEVNELDLLGLTILQTLEPSVYNFVRGHRDLLCRSALRIPKEDKEADQKDIDEFEQFIQTISSRKRPAVTNLIFALFPRFEDLYTKRDHSAGDIDSWSENLRLCAPDRFVTYFRHGLAFGGVWQREITAFLSDLATVNDAAPLLDPFIQAQKEVGLFQELRNQSDRVPLKDIPKLIRGVIARGDHLGRTFPHGYFISAAWSGMALCEELIGKLPPEERFTIVDSAISECEGSLAFQTQLAEAFRKEAAKNLVGNSDARGDGLSSAESSQITEQVIKRGLQWLEDGRLSKSQLMQQNHDGMAVLGFLYRNAGLERVTPAIQAAIQAAPFEDLLKIAYSPDNESQSIEDFKFIIKLLGSDAASKAASEASGVGAEKQLELFREVLAGRTLPRRYDIG